jgi:hypothetical protein
VLSISHTAVALGISKSVILPPERAGEIRISTKTMRSAGDTHNPKINKKDHDISHY